MGLFSPHADPGTASGGAGPGRQHQRPCRFAPRGTAFPCASAAVLPKTDALARGAAAAPATPKSVATLAGLAELAEGSVEELLDLTDDELAELMGELSIGILQVRHCLSLAFPLPFFSKTMPFLATVQRKRVFKDAATRKQGGASAEQARAVVTAVQSVAPSSGVAVTLVDVAAAIGAPDVVSISLPEAPEPVPVSSRVPPLCSM